MQAYLDLLQRVLDNGDTRLDRTGTGARSLFGEQVRYDISDGKIPLLTTKKVHWRSIVIELLWMLAGNTDVKSLQEMGVNIWNEWADKYGNLGPIYGAQWRQWKTPDRILIDQMDNLVNGLINDPFSRRHIVTAWHPGENEKMALPPCHCFVQWFVSSDKRLSCKLYQRSADIFLGVPWNMVGYSLLTHLIAKVCDYTTGEFIHSFGDVHLYENHIEQAKLQLSRTPTEGPTVELNPDLDWVTTFMDHYDDWAFTHEDFKLVGYKPQAAIKAPVAV